MRTVPRSIPVLPWRSVMVLGLAAVAAFSTAAPLLARVPVVLVAGDIAEGTPGSREAATSDLIARRRGVVMTAGDNVYPKGTLRAYRRKYEPTWGRFKQRTYPTPGNHDLYGGGSGYFRYFGSRAGPGRRGYYAFTRGAWRIVALDSDACQRYGCAAGTAQYRWLRRTLAQAKERCTLAVWHHPLFSSGVRGGQPAVRPLFRLLYRYGAEVVVSGHEHSYERLAPVGPTGTVDQRFGVRQFVVGTGGAALREPVPWSCRSERPSTRPRTGSSS